MGTVLGRIFEICFAGTMFGSMSLAAILMKLVYLLPLSKSNREGICLMLVQAAWRWTLLCAPWISISAHPSADSWDEIVRDTTDVQVQRQGGDQEKISRPLFIVANHTSFFDTILSVVLFPQSVMWRMRTYMSDYLFKMPILGTVCRCVGHFAVVFKSSEYGSFKVDEERMKIEDGKAAEHFCNGGWLCFFPEGQVNKAPEKILPLRYGGMKRALEFDAKLAALVMVGNTTVWPGKASIGGRPGKIGYTAKILAPNGARAYADELRKKFESEASPEERANTPSDAQLLALAVQERMQKDYDVVAASIGGGLVKKQD